MWFSAFCRMYYGSLGLEQTVTGDLFLRFLIFQFPAPLIISLSAAESLTDVTSARELWLW